VGASTFVHKGITYFFMQAGAEVPPIQSLISYTNLPVGKLAVATPSGQLGLVVGQVGGYTKQGPITSTL